MVSEGVARRLRAGSGGARGASQPRPSGARSECSPARACWLVTAASPDPDLLRRPAGLRSARGRRRGAAWVDSGEPEGWPSPVDGSCLENSRGDEPPGVRIPLPPPTHFQIPCGSDLTTLEALQGPSQSV